jgi:hypothetical protein
MDSWEIRRDLFPQEQHAIREYIRDGEYLNAFLRGHLTISSDQILIVHDLIVQLDNAISKSHIQRSCHLYRGISGDYAEDLFYWITTGRRKEIDDRAYASFTSDPIIAMNFATAYGNLGIIFTVKCERGECALEIGGRESEIIFPRNLQWNIITYTRTSYGGRSIIFISLEKKY